MPKLKLWMPPFDVAKYKENTIKSIMKNIEKETTKLQMKRLFKELKHYQHQK